MLPRQPTIVVKYKIDYNFAFITAISEIFAPKKKVFTNKQLNSGI